MKADSGTKDTLDLQLTDALVTQKQLEQSLEVVKGNLDSALLTNRELSAQTQQLLLEIQSIQKIISERKVLI